MPPSYSMMLPGRMSTPLIFMCEPLKEPCGLLAAGLLSGKQREGVDRAALVPFLARLHAVDGEMEVRSARIGVAGVADAADRLSALDLLALGEARRIALQMGVIIDPALVGRADVERDPAAALREEQFLDRSVGRGDHRRSFRSHDVDRVMNPGAAGPRLGVGVAELLGLD